MLTDAARFFNAFAVGRRGAFGFGAGGGAPELDFSDLILRNSKKHI
jgi:hypothetical protein